MEPFPVSLGLLFCSVRPPCFPSNYTFAAHRTAVMVTFLDPPLEAPTGHEKGQGGPKIALQQGSSEDFVGAPAKPPLFTSWVPEEDVVHHMESFFGVAWPASAGARACLEIIYPSKLPVFQRKCWVNITSKHPYVYRHSTPHAKQEWEVEWGLRTWMVLVRA